MRESLLILHFLGLVMGLGTSFGFMFLGIISSKLPEDEAKKFSFNTLGLSRMGHIGLGLLLISGFGLMTPHWVNLSNSYYLIVKLVLVAILLILITIITQTSGKIKRGTATESDFKKMKPLGQLSIITGILVIVFAVLNFQ
jgi:uncharacterized membrane protein